MNQGPITLSAGPRLRAAMILAILADIFQVIVFPMFIEGAASPADDILDFCMGAVLIRLLGWHWEFLPSFAAKRAGRRSSSFFGRWQWSTSIEKPSESQPRRRESHQRNKTGEIFESRTDVRLTNADEERPRSSQPRGRRDVYTMIKLHSARNEWPEGRIMNHDGDQQLHLSVRFTRAVDYARHLHIERRKGSDIPYMAHLLGVAALVMGEAGHAGFPVTEEMVMAALLHDAAEDHGGLRRLRDIEYNFGENVARMVEGFPTA